jgi:hypothetical protein
LNETIDTKIPQEAKGSSEFDLFSDIFIHKVSGLNLDIWAAGIIEHYLQLKYSLLIHLMQ